MSINKEIVEKAKQHLKDLGYEIKTSHVYEMFARLSGYKNWHVAKAKDVEFKNLLKSNESAPAISPEVAVSYEVEKYARRNEFSLGVNLSTGEVVHKNFRLEPNLLLAGTLGSGKTGALSLILTSWMLKNSDQTLVFLVDPHKDAPEYAALRSCPQVYSCLNNDEGTKRIIEMLYEEAITRRILFNQVEVENIEEYSAKTSKNLSRCLLAFERLDKIAYQLLNFDAEYKIEGTVAYKLHQLLRTGRSLGIWVFATAQKITKSDIPSALIPNFTSKQAFRMSRAESSYLLGDMTASEIEYSQHGRASTDDGFVQYPFISVKDQQELLPKYIVPLKTECVSFSVKDIQSKING